MDHIPLPDAPFDRHFEVPYYTDSSNSYAYSPPWASYAARQGYTDDRLHLMSADGLPAIEKPAFASFVQSWLFFGVLQEFLNHAYPIEDWIRSNAAGSSTVSTQLLCDRLQLWRHGVFARSKDKQYAERVRIDSLLDRMFDAHDGLSFKITTDKAADFFTHLDLIPEELSLSIHVLHTTLIIVRNAVFPQNCRDINPFGGKYAAINRRFMANGWCPSEVSRLRQDSSILGEYYASCLGPVSTTRDHSHCNRDTCFAAQVNQDTYEPVHASEECTYSPASLDIAHIAKCLGRGLTPLVYLDERGALRLHARNIQTATEKFVAISHVWADGLGNPRYNGLPICQLKRIQSQVDAVSSHCSTDSQKLFWMDTLCVPVGKAFTKERGLAIANMAAIYRNADSVLILNSEVRTIDSKRRSCEIAARLTRTAWFRRLWTLHEGVLARRSLFQLADVAVDITSLVVSGHGGCSRGSTIESVLCKQILEDARVPFTKLQTFRTKPHAERIRDIWSAVQWRTTSWQDDETICLANMLGLDLSPILAIDRDDPYVCEKRMKAFVLLQKCFPQTSIFEQTKMRHFRKERGFRWAPPSFVHRHQITEEADTMSSLLAPVDESGIHVQYPGVLLDWSDLNFNDDLQFFFLLAKQWDYYYTVYWTERELEISAALDGHQAASTLPAIVLKSDILLWEDKESRTRYKTFKLDSSDEDIGGEDDDYAINATDDSEDFQAIYSPAVLIAIHSNTTSIASSMQQVELQVEIICHVLVSKEMFSSYKCPATRQMGATLYNNNTSQEHVRELTTTFSPSQKWCIR